MNTHKLTLMGGGSAELRVPASVLLEALGALIDGARLATRFVVEGESVRKGPRPTWLDAACEVEVTGLTAGSAVIAVDARPLREVDEARFGQGASWSLFGAADERFGEQSAIDVFGNVLHAVVGGSREDVVADRALLESCARFARVSGGGFSGVVLEGIRGRSSPLKLTAEDVPHIERLRDETPRPQAARVTGVLDTVSASRPDVVLLLNDGTRVPGRLDAHDIEALRRMLGTEVVVSGMAHYRPSGRLLLLDVEELAVARAEDAMFRRAPAPRRQRVVDPGLAPASAARSEETASTFFGTWPGDETDAELLAALRATA